MVYVARLSRGSRKFSEWAADNNESPEKIAQTKKQKYYIVDAKRSLFFQAIKVWDKQFKPVQFGIAQDVFEFLTGVENAEMTLPTVQQIQKQGKKYELFADGTIIIPK